MKSSRSPKIGFWGYVPPDIINSYREKYANPDFIDLDIEIGAPETKIIPDSSCKIIKNIIDNSIYLKNELAEIIAPIGKDKCDSAYFASQILKENGLISESECKGAKIENTGTVDYSKLYRHRLELVKKAAAGINSSDRDYLSFCEDQCFWLEKYSVFAALKEKNDMLPHYKWKYKSADDIAKLKKEISLHSKIQYSFGYHR